MMRTATRGPVTTSRVMPAKTKIMSILDRARVALEESRYSDEVSSYGHGRNFGGFEDSNSPNYRYEEQDYSPDDYYRKSYGGRFENSIFVYESRK